MTPKVTVFIPVYNRATYIGAAIDSVLAQRFRDFELLLIDDGSTDGSVDVMRAYCRDSRVRVVCNETNLGIPQTRNRGTALARGEYLAMLDSDDVAHPTRLAKQVTFLDSHPEYALIGAWTQTMREDGHLLKRMRLAPTSPGEVRARLLFQGGPIQSTVLARTAILREYTYDERYVVCEDYDLWIRLAQRYKLGNLPEVLVQSRRHSGRITYEKAALIKDYCVRMNREQLAELGVAFTAADVERHFLLLRMSEHQYLPNMEYVDWTEAWLHKVKEANDRTSLYPQRPLHRLLGQIWLVVCWRAASELRGRVWKHFWRSPLRREVWAAGGMAAYTLTFRRMPRDR